ncbi:class I adenylate-forming enzyme family protein [Roseobacteraceae bacterium S113]
MELPHEISLLDRGPFAPCPAPFNMAAHVLAHAPRLPDKIALAVLGPARAERWSYGSLEAAVRGTATGLLQSGLVPGDRVMLRLGNTPDFPIAYLGAIAAGLLPVPTSPQLTETEVAKLYEIITPAAVLQASDVAGAPHTKIIPQEALRAFRTLPPAPYGMGDPNRPAYIVFTSGTSGTPRAVVHAHRAIWARQMMHDGWYAMTEADRILHAGGFNWTFTLGTGLMDPWSLGATALIPAPGTEPAMLPLLLKRHDATLFAAAPGVFRQILKQNAPLSLPKLRHALAAGEKLPEAVRDAFRAASGKEVYEAYGMSECSTFISAAPGAPATTGALGTAQPGRRVALIEDGAIVALGTEGEIAVSTQDPGVMLGYWGASEVSAQRMRDGWFFTGDRAVMQPDGQILYTGRGDDMMNAGGFRVSPLEIEHVMATLEGVTSVAVTEVEIKPGVRVIAAFYTGPACLPEPTLHAHAERHLARYKHPRLYCHLDALPTGPNGKLSRRTLRQSYASSAQT